MTNLGLVVREQGNAYVTGYVLYSLSLPKQPGTVSARMCVSRGLGGVQNYFKKSSDRRMDAIAYLMYINALWGRWDHEMY